MSADNVCKICKNHIFATRELHKCPPLWLCLDVENYGDDWDESYKIYAASCATAARQSASLMDENGDAGARERRIHVQDATGNIRVFDITFDYSVDYYASEVKP